MGHRAAHSTGIEGGATDRAGLPVSSAPSARVQGLDSCRLGSIRKQPQGQVLFADTHRTKAARSRTRELGPYLHRDRPGARVGGIFDAEAMVDAPPLPAGSQAP